MSTMLFVMDAGSEDRSPRAWSALVRQIECGRKSVIDRKYGKVA